MTKLELKRKILKVLKVFNSREEAIFDICWKEIAELKNKLTEKVTEKSLDIVSGKIEELEQENERLKGDLELWESGGCRATNLFECGVVKELKEQLTKATKLLKWALHSDPEHDNLVDFDTKWKEAEQFLKEIKEKE